MLKDIVKELQLISKYINEGQPDLDNAIKKLESESENITIESKYCPDCGKLYGLTQPN